MPRDRLFDSMRDDSEIEELDAEYPDRQLKVQREDSVGDDFQRHFDGCDLCKTVGFGACKIGRELFLAK